MTLRVDAVVVGGGHHGLVAAAVLADAGWDVCLLEASDRMGGAVRSAQLHPGCVTDLYSAFYPLTVASPMLRALRLDEHGLRWSHAPAVKVNWALDGPVPCRAAGLRGAGTVHLGCDETQMGHWSADIESATIPRTRSCCWGR